MNATFSRASQPLQFSSVQSLSHVRFFATPLTAARQASLSITNSTVYSNSCPSSQWCHPTISSSVVPFSSCLQSFPASVFSNESTLCIRWPKSWSFSISISPSNEYSGLISSRVSLQFKGLSRVFPNNTVQKRQFFSSQPSLQSSYDFYFGLGERAFSGLLKDVCPTSFQCIDKKQNTSEINWLRNAQTSSHLGSTLLIILCCPGYQDLGDVASLKWGSTAVSGVFSLAADIWSARLCF